MACGAYLRKCPCLFLHISFITFVLKKKASFHTYCALREFLEFISFAAFRAVSFSFFNFISITAVYFSAAKSPFCLYTHISRRRIRCACCILMIFYRCACAAIYAAVMHYLFLMRRFRCDMIIVAAYTCCLFRHRRPSAYRDLAVGNRRMKRRRHTSSHHVAHGFARASRHFERPP